MTTPPPAATGSVAERVARMEGEVQHLATAADLERLRSEVERLRSDLNRNMVATVGIATAIILGAMRLWL